MYPRVKVKDQDKIPQEEATCHPRVKVLDDPLIGQQEATEYLMRIIESLAFDDSSSDGWVVKHEEDHIYHPPSCAKISKSQFTDSPSPSLLRSKGKTCEDANEHNKSKMKASSVPRPRAVLSSPDNDEMIGHRNQGGSDKKTPGKKLAPGPRIHVQPKQGCTTFREQRTPKIRETWFHPGSGNLKQNGSINPSKHWKRMNLHNVESHDEK